MQKRQRIGRYFTLFVFQVWQSGVFFVIAQDTGTGENQPIIIDETTPEETNIDIPVIDEPIVDEPIVDEPIVDEPIVDEPIVDEPIVDEPIVDEPIVDEPIVDEPIVDEPIVDENSSGAITTLYDTEDEDEIRTEQIDGTSLEVIDTLSPQETEYTEIINETIYDTDDGEDIRTEPSIEHTNEDEQPTEDENTPQDSVIEEPIDQVDQDQENGDEDIVYVSGSVNTGTVLTGSSVGSGIISSVGVGEEENTPLHKGTKSITITKDMHISNSNDSVSKKITLGAKRKVDTDTTNTRSANSTIKANTIVTSMIQGSISLNELTVREIQEKPSNFSSSFLGGVHLGPDNDHLIFSQPVVLEIPVDTSLNGQEVAIFVEHVGDTKYNTSGITNNPNAQCDGNGSVLDPEMYSNYVEVIDGIATIYTCGASVFTVTYTGGATAANFVDNGTLTKTLTVGAGGSIQDIQVIVDFQPIDSEDPTSYGVTNAYSDEVSMTIESPSGTIVDLLDPGDYTDQSFSPRVTVTFDDAAGSAPTGLPATGTYLPVGNLSDFDTEDPIGDWTFSLSDNTNADGVILFAVTLQITDNATCGDSTLEGAEGCDDGGTTPGDGCDASCLIENTYACNSSGNGAEYDVGCASGVCDQTEATATCEAADTCGNAALEGSEECDDGNTTDGDGCSSVCAIEWCGNSTIDPIATFTTLLLEDFESINGTTQTNNTTLTSTTGYTLTYQNSGVQGRVRYGTNAVQTNGGVGAATLDVTPTGTFVTNHLVFEVDLLEVKDATDITLAFDWSDHGDEDQVEDIVEIRGYSTGSWIEVYDWKANDIGNGTYQSVSGIDIDTILSTAGQAITSTFQVRFGQNDNFSANNANANDGFSLDNVQISGTVPGPAVAETCDDSNDTSGDGCSSTCQIESGYTCTGEPSVCFLCGNGVIGTGEVCDDGNTDDGDGCSSTCQLETDRQCSGAPSACILCTAEDIIIGYNVSSVDDTIQSIAFSAFTNNTFNTPPIVLATPQTDNSTNNYPIPVIENITTTGFDISICLDDGSTTCAASPPTEEISIFVIDPDRTACVDHIEAGTTSVTTDGTDTAFTFASGFTNVPYVFTTPQTASQGNNIAAHAWVDDNSLSVNGGDFVGCVHQGIANACTAGQPNETLGWIAVDPSLFTMTGYQDGTQGISNSTWTNVTFSPTYNMTPGVMVTQNSDNGGQDPEYAWARDVTTGSADIRYCEADAGGVCNSHTSEDVMWFSLDIDICGNGEINTGETCDDGNTTDSDGCDSSCQIESGYSCTGEPSVCTSGCGNGTTAGSEECDDGNTADGDGCSSVCTAESGYICKDNALCGNGTVDDGEQCDDGNTTDGDGCSQYCIDEYDFYLADFTQEFLNPDNGAGGGGGLGTGDVVIEGSGYAMTVPNSLNPYPMTYYSPFNFRDLSAPRAVELAFSGAADDDYIGYVFGWQPGDWTNPSADYILVMRKDVDQFFDFTDTAIAGGTAFAGLSVARVQGVIALDELWQIQDDAATTGTITLLATGTTYGNVGYTPSLYDTSVFYNTGSLEVYVDGTLDISLTGSFEDGRFGIFVFAQQGNTFVLSKPHPYSIAVQCFPECGDGIITDTETCDDGNTINGDGCSEFCATEQPDECALGTDDCNALETCVNSYEGRDCVCEIDDCTGVIGDVCIFGPDGFDFSGTVISDNLPYQLIQQFTGYFEVEDTLGIDSGYYTTLQVSDFTGSTYGDMIPHDNLERYATGITLISGDANTNVILATGRSSYRIADLTYTFILRDPAPNANKTGTYGTLPWLRLTIPPYTRPDTYTSEITYTLYEN